jgi:hypothetical protein
MTNSAKSPSESSGVCLICTSYIDRLTPEKKRIFGIIVLNLLQLIHIVVVTIVNVIYVTCITTTIPDSYFFIKGEYRVFIPIALSIFKFFWEILYVSKMINCGITANLSSDLLFFYYMFSLIFMNILVPIIIIYSTSVSCFYYYSLSTIPHCEVSYNDFYSEPNCGLHLVPILDSITLYSYSCSFNVITIPVTSNITPNWVYSYSCVSSLFITYIPALISNYTVSGVIMPLLQAFLLSFHRTSWVRNNYFVKKLLPYTLNSIPDDEMESNHVKRQERTQDFLSNMAVDILNLFTFGIASGFLTYLIIFSMLMTELMRQLQFGSYLQDRYMVEKEKITKEEKSKEKKTQEEKTQEKDEETKNELTPNSDANSNANDKQPQTQPSLGKLFFIIGPCLFDDDVRFKFISLLWRILFLTIFLFWSLFMFDAIADDYDDISGFIGIFVFWLYMGIGFYSINRMKNRMKKAVAAGKGIVGVIINRKKRFCERVSNYVTLSNFCFFCFKNPSQSSPDNTVDGLEIKSSSSDNRDSRKSVYGIEMT